MTIWYKLSQHDFNEKVIFYAARYLLRKKSNNHLKEVTVKIRERYRASTYAQLEETASGDSNRVKEKRFLSFIALGNAVLADEFLARAYNKQESFRFGVMSTSSIQQARYATVASGHAVLPHGHRQRLAGESRLQHQRIPICCT